MSPLLKMSQALGISYTEFQAVVYFWLGQKLVFASFSLLIRYDQNNALIVWQEEVLASVAGPKEPGLLFRCCAFLEKKHSIGVRDSSTHVTLKTMVLILLRAYDLPDELVRMPMPGACCQRAPFRRA